ARGACWSESGGVFFFSSRRRHTRSKRDWSADVCSSDLGRRPRGCRCRAPARDRRHRQPRGRLPARGGERVMILLKSKDEIEHMRRANVMVAEILAEVRARVRPGVTTAELGGLAEELTLKRGARPAFKGYTVAGRAFPASICVSVNDEVVHGVPSRKAAPP